jgi:hypothetical protein
MLRNERHEIGSTGFDYAHPNGDARTRICFELVNRFSMRRKVFEEDEKSVRRSVDFFEGERFVIARDGVRAKGAMVHPIERLDRSRRIHERPPSHVDEAERPDD